MTIRLQIDKTPFFVCRLGDVFNAAEDQTKAVLCAFDRSGAPEAFGDVVYVGRRIVSAGGRFEALIPEHVQATLTRWVPDPNAQPSTPDNPSFGFKSETIGQIAVFKDATVKLNLTDPAPINLTLQGFCLGQMVFATGPDGSKYTVAFEIADQPT